MRYRATVFSLGSLGFRKSVNPLEICAICSLGRRDMAHIIIFSRGFAADNIWAIHVHLFLDFEGKGRVWALDKPAFLERQDSLLMDAKAARPVDTIG